MNASLAKQLGEDQPFIFVTLTPEDLQALGENPTFERIATFHVEKILAIQPKGPYVLGGHCVGSILAYEIASQLTAAGHEVSHLLLLDVRNPAYVQSRTTLVADAVSQLRYYVERGRRIGLSKSLTYFSWHVRKRFGKVMEIAEDNALNMEMRIAQDIIETAAFAYNPPRFQGGKVLLLLSSERPAHVDFVPGWKAVIDSDLHVQFLNFHHRDVMKGDNVKLVAHAIKSHLASSSEKALAATK